MKKNECNKISKAGNPYSEYLKKIGDVSEPNRWNCKLKESGE